MYVWNCKLNTGVQPSYAFCHNKKNTVSLPNPIIIVIFTCLMKRSTQSRRKSHLGDTIAPHRWNESITKVEHIKKNKYQI